MTRMDARYFVIASFSSTANNCEGLESNPHTKVPDLKSGAYAYKDKFRLDFDLGNLTRIDSVSYI